MENIEEQLNQKVRKRKGNPLYGVATDLQQELDIPIGLCFKLIKKYSPEQIAKFRQWWRAYTRQLTYRRKNNIGLVLWKFKQMFPENKG